MGYWDDERSEGTRRRREAALEAAFLLFSKNTIEEIRMEDIAKEAHIGVVGMYCYFGTKLALCVELGALKWREYTKVVEDAYRKKNGEAMNAVQEFEFYIDCYLDLYENHKALLRFNQNFDLFTMHENASAEDMADYYASVSYFEEKFHTVYEKALSDHTIRTDLTEQELFFSVMYTMLPTAQKLASGLIYPKDSEYVSHKILERQKEMLLQLAKAK